MEDYRSAKAHEFWPGRIAASCSTWHLSAESKRKRLETTGNWSGQAAGSGEGFDLTFQAIGQLIECRLAKRLTKQVRQV